MPEPHISLRDAVLKPAESDELTLGSLELGRGRVVAICGPAGVGKSLLLRALAGRLPDDCELRGTWCLGGEPADGLQPPDARELGVRYIRQPPRASATDGDAGAQNLRSMALVALGARGTTVLLDEPDRAFRDAHRQRLLDAIGHRGEETTVIFATHDQQFVRAVADEVILLVAGRVEAHCSARRFFERPPTPLARRFTTSGNCWPAGALTAPLPVHFFWLLRNALAGMGRPGLSRDIEEDLKSIAGAGIDVMVSLTRLPTQRDLLRPYGIELIHLPIRDMGAPRINQAATVCRKVSARIDDGGRAVFHCHAGIGRTGTMLAAMLVWRGVRAGDAVEQVRAENDRCIQTRTQEQFVHRFAEAVGSG